MRRKDLYPEEKKTNEFFDMGQNNHESKKTEEPR
jgi:hypothetical protein